jgi:hypothetical protein
MKRSKRFKTDDDFLVPPDLPSPFENLAKWKQAPTPVSHSSSHSESWTHSAHFRSSKQTKKVECKTMTRLQAFSRSVAAVVQTLLPRGARGVAVVANAQWYCLCRIRHRVMVNR